MMVGALTTILSPGLRVPAFPWLPYSDYGTIYTATIILSTLRLEACRFFRGEFEKDSYGKANQPTSPLSQNPHIEILT